MPIKDYSTTPSNNTAINGINIAEGCAPSNINNAIRQLMADLADKQALKAFLNVVIGVDVQAYDPKLYNMVVPVGGSLDWNGENEPEGWMFEDGRAISRTTYPALFAVIGTKFGAGNGSTTFNIPDSCGRVSAGLNRGKGRLTAKAGGVDGDVLGAVGGTERHKLTAEQLPPHSHNVNIETTEDGDHTHNYTISKARDWDSAAGDWIGQGGNALVRTGTERIHWSGRHKHRLNGVTDNSGSGQDHNNVQPTIIKNKIIRVL